MLTVETIRRAPSKTIINMRNENQKIDGKKLLSNDKNWTQAGNVKTMQPNNVSVVECTVFGISNSWY